MDIWFVTWSPDSKYLLYSYGNGHPYNLYKVKLNEARDGIADLWNLTQAPSTSSTLVWGPAYISPDGNYIVANRIYNGWPRLRIITNRDTNAHEGDWTPIGKNYGMSVNPSWKPDSSTIVYAYYDNYQHNNHSDICTILPNGTNDTILVDRSRTQQHTQTVAWCQSGSNLAFAEGLWSQTTKPLGLMTADGTNINWLDQGPAGLPWQHYSWQADLWSPDGSSILYSCKEDGNWNIYLIDKDGSNKRLVASSGGTDVLARFSGDGTVAFQTNRNGNWDIYIATSGPCNTEPVADAGDDQEVSTGAGGTVEVVLDCSDSSDPDGDELTYCWKWTGGQDCDATGVNPTIVLSCGTYVIELIVSDGTADSEPDYVQITVLDGTAPVISCPGDVTLECPADTNPANTGTATATDNCDDEPAITYGDVLSGSCPEVIVRTWTATDDAGNSSSCEQT
ncbi:MAG: hypothetical protein GWN67_03330, partial [Phycisphaerae bacterium]|nr:hypothetical protein [Phycisphaerae bacterium]NIR63883.1 hypothetical protein [candidate division Zixibacteria bacterium]NIP52006.1 hypothetical protein [Phycisphaerae bacterium]NIS53783.1 hypothetical protein [Phycisphaerae bacterium]NIU08741.1 hypothetical protein [Phycisphaerae bacterium]